MSHNPNLALRRAPDPSHLWAPMVRPLMPHVRKKKLLPLSLTLSDRNTRERNHLSPWHQASPLPKGGLEMKGIILPASTPALLHPCYLREQAAVPAWRSANPFSTP